MRSADVGTETVVAALWLETAVTVRAAPRSLRATRITLARADSNHRRHRFRPDRDSETA